MAFRQGENEIILTIEVEAGTGDLLIGGSGIADTTNVYGFRWGCENLDIRNIELILPAHGGQVFTSSSAFDTRSYYYPRLWEAQLAIVQGKRGGFFVRGTDKTFRFKQFNFEKDGETMALSFETHNQAPWDSLTRVESVRWRFNTYAGDYRIPAQIYRHWMEEAFEPWRLSEVPSWVEDIGLVIQVRLFDLNQLEELAKEIDPSKTLLYLVTWRKDGYDKNYPDYTAKEGIGDYIEAAHGHGFRVMLHVNLVGMHPYHPLYPEFKEYQFRKPGRGHLTGLEWNKPDNPHRYAYINNASSKFRDLLVSRFQEVWEEYRVDAFHLDISIIVINDANGLIEGLNSGQGNVLMHKELAAAMPGVVFSGEMLHEVTFFRESFAQRFPLPPEATSHPISAFLFSRYTRPYGHLGFPDLRYRAEEYHRFLDAYDGWGVLPTLRDRDLRQPYAYGAEQILSIARQWQSLGLRPDFESDWADSTLFQFVTADGETVVYQEINGGTEYNGVMRIHGVTQVDTRLGLPYWRAYNETSVLGLDPDRRYMLTDIPRDFSQVHINSLPVGVSVMESRVTDHTVLFRLAFKGAGDPTLPVTVGLSVPPSPNYTVETDLSEPIIIFLTEPQPVDIPFDLRSAQFASGFEYRGILSPPTGRYRDARKSRTTIDGVRKKTIYAHPYPDRPNFVSFSLHLPETPKLRLSFSMGLTEGCSQGVTFRVLLNGEARFEYFKNTFDWTEGGVSLGDFSGKPVLLELVTDPAQSGLYGANCDRSSWGDLLITAAPNPDANHDGQINVLDLIVVASSLGEQPPSNPLADTNKDGVVNLLDLVFVAEHLSQNAAAPAQLRFIEAIPSSAKEVIAAQRALTELEAIPNRTPRIQIAIELLRHYLAVADRNVKETKLLPNYPNPFNPETWIPYQLSEESTITVKIYDVTGSLVRTIDVGLKPMGYYLTRERAVYWDGRNENGERISSGVYFYTLIAADYTETRRMVIVK